MQLLYPYLLFAAFANVQAFDSQVPLGTSMLDRIPLLGFGTWNLKHEEAPGAVSYAIQVGYRHIDAAAIYRNEKFVGKGIADGLSKAGLNRGDIWVTSKLWNDHHAPDKVEEAIDQTLDDLGLDYLDLYHMHWPVASTENGNEIDFIDTWKAMIRLVQSGKTRHIGVANFSPSQLGALLDSTTHPPLVHQMELHPYLQQNDFIAQHKALGIHVTAYSPFGGTNPIYGDPKDAPPHLLENEVVGKIAEARNCTPAQVVLSWGLNRGTSVIPKSSHANHISENFNSPTCELRGTDYKSLASLGKKFTHRFNNPSKSWHLRLYDGLEDS